MMASRIARKLAQRRRNVAGELGIEKVGETLGADPNGGADPRQRDIEKVCVGLPNVPNPVIRLHAAVFRSTAPMRVHAVGTPEPLGRCTETAVVDPFMKKSTKMRVDARWARRAFRIGPERPDEGEAGAGDTSNEVAHHQRLQSPVQLTGKGAIELDVEARIGALPAISRPKERSGIVIGPPGQVGPVLLDTSGASRDGTSPRTAFTRRSAESPARREPRPTWR